jgi:hypothetical protein
LGNIKIKRRAPGAEAAGLFHALIDHPKCEVPMLLQIRGRRPPARSKLTVIEVRLNIGYVCSASRQSSRRLFSGLVSQSQRPKRRQGVSAGPSTDRLFGARYGISPRMMKR